MHSKRLGLGILTTLAAMTLAACDNGSPATTVSPDQPEFARGGSGGGNNPHTTSTTPRIAVSPTSMQASVGGGGWFKVTLYDKNGNALPDNDGSLVWFGCTPANPALQNCMGYINIAPVYPTLRDAYVSALGAGQFTVWADDGYGHRASVAVTVQ